ncbi:MAG: GNAT family N-acetyltransferase [Legionellaceae bacterium]|nr:GNAT family N-acetyltransferase [Legionellaceae bacterium]
MAQTIMMKPILFNLPMPIQTERLLIRPPQLGDGHIINAAIVESYDVLKSIMPWAQIVPTVEDSEEYVRLAAANWILKQNEEPYLPLSIFRLDTMEYIGGTGFHHMDWDVPAFETGYWLHVRHQNQGYMTEAVNAITRYAFLALHAKRLEIRCDITNVRSKKIPERLSFYLEATLKKNRINPQTQAPSDTLIYAIYDLDSLPALSVHWPTANEAQF